MIPVLFKKNEQQFRTYGLGEITDIINPKVTRERNGQYLLYFQYPQNAEFSDVFEEDMRIKSDAGVRTKWQTFEISRVVRKEGQLIEVFAKHISQSLLKDALNPEVNVRSSTAQQALRIWNNNRIGDEDFDVWSDISTVSSTSWNIREVSNAFEALAGVQGSILDVWGGEYEFDNKMIRLHKEMGRKSPVPLEYGRNITGIEQDKQEDNVYTSVYPFATYIPESGSEPETVTLPERYVDGKYLEMHNKRKIQVVDFSGEYDNDNPPTVSNLRTLANRYLEANEVGLSRENLKVEYIDLSKTLDYQDFQTMEEVELNDRLPIFYPKFGITNESAKVVVINYDPVKEENISIELGVIGQSFRTVTTGGIGSRLDRVEKQQTETTKYIVNNKGNRIWFETPDETMEHKIGDTWFEKNGPYDRIRVWNGNQWEVIIDTEDVDKIAKEVESAQADIEETKQKTDETAQQIDTAVSSLGFVDLPSALSSFDGELVTHQETLDGMQSIVYDPERGVASLNTQLADLVQVAVTGEELSNAITVSEQGILGQVVKNDEVIARINASEEGILLQANKIQALGDVVVDGKLTITDEFIAPNAQIDGAKIADATINSAKIISLDVDQLSGNKAELVQLGFNGISDSVFVNSSGLISNASNGSQGVIQNGVFLTRVGNTTLGYIGYGQPGSDNRPFYTINLSQGAHFRTRHHLGSENYKHGLLINAGAEYAEFNINRVHFNQQITLGNNANHAIASRDLYRLNIMGNESVGIGGNHRTVLAVSASNNTGYATFFANLNMNGYYINNAAGYNLRSERKYKSNIIPLEHAMREVERLNIYSYDKMDEDGQLVPELGIIVDEAPECVLGLDGKTVDMYSYISLIGKSQQELITMVKEMKEEIETLKRSA